MTDRADDVAPASGALPPLRTRDLPPPIPLRQMIGPSIMLAGLALGSGEFVFWPFITYKSGFVFFWACVLGVITQFFVNMEITRWALATGESAVTGFARLSKHWAGIFLFLNVVPWMIPAWAMGSSQLLSWLTFGATLDPTTGKVASPHVDMIAIASLFFCGIALTAGPVVYNTVEKIQLFLVSFIMIVAVVLGCMLIRSDAWLALLDGLTHFRFPPPSANLDSAMLLGAIAFAGAGGTMNLCQSNYVKEKGYGMGTYIGRMTSPITGKEEAVSETGYAFPTTEENLSRWRSWWRAANLEHFLSFFCTCILCLFLMALIAYSVYYKPDGTRIGGVELKDMAFIFGEADAVGESLGNVFRIAFLAMGVAILFTTEIGVLDAASRISTDIVKVNWLLDNKRWSESRLYFFFLWGTIGLASLIVWIGANKVESTLSFFKLTASLNGAVMFIYSALLLFLNLRRLPQPIRISTPRAIMLAWSVLFFGSFAVWTGWKVLVG